MMTKLNGVEKLNLEAFEQLLWMSEIADWQLIHNLVANSVSIGGLSKEFETRYETLVNSILYKKLNKVKRNEP